MLKPVSRALALAALLASAGLVAKANAQAEKSSGSVEQTHGEWRASLVNGADVYNDHADKIGTVNDMLIDQKGHIANVVLSVGGFLGVGSKYVEVPFSRLKFEPSSSNPEGMTASGTAPSNASKKDYSVTLPGATKDSLKAMADFDYNK